MEDHSERISIMTGFMMVGFSASIDMLGLLVGPIPAVGSILSIFAYISLMLWFTLCGVNFFSGRAAGKKMVTLIAGFMTEFLAGLLPILGGFVPATTISTMVLISQSRKEDKEEAAAKAAKPAAPAKK